MTRPMSSELVSASARCQRCSWTCDARNSQALAAQHHDKKQHMVVFEKTERITYGRGGVSTVRKSEQGRLI